MLSVSSPKSLQLLCFLALLSLDGSRSCSSSCLLLPCCVRSIAMLLLFFSFFLGRPVQEIWP